jgi:tetratricopeptide (TPR) repeat protein
MRIGCIGLVILLSTVIIAPALAYAADDVAAAKEHFGKGKRLYDLGKFAEAAAEYAAAYEAKDDAALLFNLGQAHRLAGNYSQAVLAYKAYIRNLPQAPNRADVESRIREIQAIVAKHGEVNHEAPQGAATAPLLAQNKREAPAALAPLSIANLGAPERAEHSRPLYKRWWPWTVAGAVVVGVGVTLAVVFTVPSNAKAPAGSVPVNFP